MKWLRTASPRPVRWSDEHGAGDARRAGPRRHDRTGEAGCCAVPSLAQWADVCQRGGQRRFRLVGVPKHGDRFCCQSFP